MQGIYTHIPETNSVPREYSVVAILLLLFMVLISLLNYVLLLLLLLLLFCNLRYSLPALRSLIVGLRDGFFSMLHTPKRFPLWFGFQGIQDHSSAHTVRMTEGLHAAEP